MVGASNLLLGKEKEVMNPSKINLIFSVINAKSMVIMSLSASHIFSAIIAKDMVTIVMSVEIEEHKIKSIMPK